MPSSRLALIAAVTIACLWAASAGAAVGEYRLVTGTVAWPLQVGAERTIVIQTDDGSVVFVELAPAENVHQLRAGHRVSVVGREGFKPDQLLFAQIERREDDTDGAPAALPTEATTARPAESPDIIVGVVNDVHDTALTLITPRGYPVNVDIAAMDPEILAALGPGDRVSVFAPRRASGFPIASGIVVEHASSPAASPK